MHTLIDGLVDKSLTYSLLENECSLLLFLHILLKKASVITHATCMTALYTLLYYAICLCKFFILRLL